VAFLPREGTLATLISAGMRRMSGSVRRQRLQRSLVVVQVAVSVVLLSGAGLLTRTMIQLSDVPTGLRTEELLTIQVPLLTPSQIMSDPTADVGAKARYAAIREELRALPGVTEVGVGSPMPLRTSGVRFEMKAEDRPLAVGEALPRAELRTASPEFFRAAGIPLLSGRDFTAGDRFGTAMAVAWRGPARSSRSRRSRQTGERSSGSSPRRRTVVSTPPRARRPTYRSRSSWRLAADS
jgi:putative ABC transport system permease protein